MKQRFIIFDVETPNRNNDRMSAIGITVVEDEKILGGYYHLVNPDTHFDIFNMSLTGITPQMVENKPNFKKLWEVIRPVMESGLLVAHNAPFDMSVLAKCLNSYKIDWKDTVNFACTCQMSKKAFPNLANHKLCTLSSYLGLELDHHNAASDSNAAACVLTHCMRLGTDIENFIRTYDLNNIKTIKRP